jgi:hypothetical protein
MAKKKEMIKPKSTMDMSWDELFETRQWGDNYNMALYGKPTKEYQIGEHVTLGNLKNVTIAHIYGDGIYAVEIPHPAKSDKNAPTHPERRIVKWVDIEKRVTPNTDTPFTGDYRMPNFSQSDMSSIIHMNRDNGFVMDTRFQRGYVWSQEDREALLDTIFNQGTIGSFLFNRHFGFEHKNSDAVDEFRTITGETVLIPRKDNFTVSVIDGQQRITTLINFYLDRWKYKGLYFSQLTFKDQSTFERARITYALVDESDGWGLKDWVWLFLQSNKGVSQSREHLAKMEEYYETL